MATADLIVTTRLRGRRWLSVAAALIGAVPSRWRPPVVGWALRRVRGEVRTAAGTRLASFRCTAEWDDIIGEFVVTPRWTSWPA